jgi:hypothetical protein
METHRIAATVATLLTLAAAQADVFMGLAVNKRHYQRNAFKVDFDSGELNLILRDGLVILAPCATDPQLFFFGPSIPCPWGRPDSSPKATSTGTESAMTINTGPLRA